jgi:hypothetical protein
VKQTKHFRPGVGENPSTIFGQAVKAVCGNCEGSVATCGVCVLKEFLNILEIQQEKGCTVKEAAKRAHELSRNSLKEINGNHDDRYLRLERHPSEMRSTGRIY